MATGFIEIILVLFFVLLLTLLIKHKRKKSFSGNICSNCGAENDLNASFCRECGSKIFFEDPLKSKFQGSDRSVKEKFLDGFMLFSAFIFLYALISLLFPIVEEGSFGHIHYYDAFHITHCFSDKSSYQRIWMSVAFASGLSTFLCIWNKK